MPFTHKLLLEVIEVVVTLLIILKLLRESENNKITHTYTKTNQPTQNTKTKIKQTKQTEGTQKTPKPTTTGKSWEVSLANSYNNLYVKLVEYNECNIMNQIATILCCSLYIC